MAGYSFHIAFYATGLRKDDLSAALSQLAPISARYGAGHWAVYQSTDDLYRQVLIVDFADKMDFQKFWYGAEASEFRAAMSGAFQNPVVYVPQNIVAEGSAVTKPAPAPAV
jgi:hypothetical protein